MDLGFTAFSSMMQAGALSTQHIVPEPATLPGRLEKISFSHPPPVLSGQRVGRL